MRAEKMPVRSTEEGPRSSTPLRCAIYTRKSSEEGLNQEFNSLEAQREAAASYIASQRQLGWILGPERYDDGGYTGGNLDRPALQKLLRDIAQGTIDCVLVYKVDRLSRSLLDFPIAATAACERNGEVALLPHSNGGRLLTRSDVTGSSRSMVGCTPSAPCGRRRSALAPSG